VIAVLKSKIIQSLDENECYFNRCLSTKHNRAGNVFRAGKIVYPHCLNIKFVLHTHVTITAP